MATYDKQELDAVRASLRSEVSRPHVRGLSASVATRALLVIGDLEREILILDSRLAAAEQRLTQRAAAASEGAS